MSVEKKKIYIIVSQTGTVLSRILKRITGAKYNHVSISPWSDLHLMYSFGRRHPYNPFWAGYVKESPAFGTFKRFTETQVKVLELSVTEEQYEEIRRTLEEMFEERKKYHYNYLGLYLAAFHIRRSRERCYYCSEFVREILMDHASVSGDCFPPITHPIHFLNIEEAHTIYCGRLQDYVI